MVIIVVASRQAYAVGEFPPFKQIVQMEGRNCLHVAAFANSECRSEIGWALIRSKQILIILKDTRGSRAAQIFRGGGVDETGVIIHDPME